MNYYEILEISKNSDTRSIKKHYYSLSKKYHPDKNNGISDEKFKLLSEAYSTLSNPKKRYLYDMKLFFNENLGKDFVLNLSSKMIFSLRKSSINFIFSSNVSSSLFI